MSVRRDRFSAERPSRLFSVTQSDYDFQEALAERSSLGLMQAHWALSLGNLVGPAAELEYAATIDGCRRHAEPRS